jgi:hypothetical protein
MLRRGGGGGSHPLGGVNLLNLRRNVESDRGLGGRRRGGGRVRRQQGGGAGGRLGRRLVRVSRRVEDGLRHEWVGCGALLLLVLEELGDLELALVRLLLRPDAEAQQQDAEDHQAHGTDDQHQLPPRQVLVHHAASARPAAATVVAAGAIFCKIGWR